MMRTKHVFASATLLLAAFFVTVAANARVWRVNNNAGVSADFRELNDAFNSGAVQPDDVIYLEGSQTNYQNAYLNKRLTIIGPGYFLGGAGANTGLQHHPYPGQLNQLAIGPLASGSQLMGISSYIRLHPDVDNITITRSSIYLESDLLLAGTSNDNLVINKCIVGFLLNAQLNNPQITNNIVTYLDFKIPNVVNGLIRNNVITVAMKTANSYISNNIFTNGVALDVQNCSIKYNISTADNLPAGFNNQVNIPYASIFVGTGSTDGQYQLAPGSPAIGAGEPLNETPDCGAFGTADPYRLSGIPPIPTIYGLTVPSSIPSTARTINVTLQTRSNN